MNTPTTPPGTKPFDVSEFHRYRLDRDRIVIRRDGEKGVYLFSVGSQHAIEWDDAVGLSWVNNSGHARKSGSPSVMDAFLPEQ